MRGINKVILIGTLGDEPLCRQTASGLPVANLSLVTGETRRSPETGQNTEFAEWHRVVLWSRLAEIARDYLHKGGQIYVEGRLRTRSYQDKQNQKRYVTEIIGDELLMLGARPAAADRQAAADGQDGCGPEGPRAINLPEPPAGVSPPVTAENQYSGEIPF